MSADVEAERAANLAAVAVTGHPAFVAGYEAGLAHGRAQVEDQLLSQEQLLDELERRWRRWALDHADLQRLAHALAKVPTHLELVRRRYIVEGQPPGAAASAALRVAETHHARVWSGWPHGDTA